MCWLWMSLLACDRTDTVQRPNVLFCIADDWGWPHAGAYGDQAVSTPTFDKLAKEGVLFDHAFVSSPSCTPSRSSILTGQDFWRLDQSANLYSTLDVQLPVYPLLLEEEGYHVGSWRKSWGPGDLTAGGYETHLPAGQKYEQGFGAFLKARPADAPFCFWLGASDPHRAYEKGSGAAAGINPDAVDVPGFYPDVPEIRSDIADYYFEVQRFDADVGAALALLDSIGELENTIVVMTGDHGMPFPRCKSNLYDMGVRVPLVISWKQKIKSVGRILEDFVSLTDLAPTFLEVCGVEVPEQMSGRSLSSVLTAGDADQVVPGRQYAIFGRERHVPAQLAPSLDGYPSRGIRTDDFLYIRNFFPDRWPVGVPKGATHPIDIFADCDAGPTKTYLLENQDDPQVRRFFDLSFSKRPAEELYHVAQDPDQLINLADHPEHQSTKETLSARLMNELQASGDPRAAGGEANFDQYPYRSKYGLNKKK